MTLHVTNGEVLAQRLSGLGLPGIILPWREILHEGPLPLYASFDEQGRRAFNAERAAFIIQQGWGTPEDVVFDMDQRDSLILNRSWSEVILWFERDLYDQLSMAQILTLMRGGGSFRDGGVWLVYSDHHLSSLTNDELRARYERRTMIDADLCDHYGQFFTEIGQGAVPQPLRSAPQALQDAAVRWRSLQPDATGFSDFDRRLLELIKRHGPIDVRALFDLLQEEDGHDAFMSDLAFHSRITSLAKRSDDIELTDKMIAWTA